MVKKVLVADDDDLIRDDYIKRIKRWANDVEVDVLVDEVSNGASLVDKVKSGSYSLIIADDKMPVSLYDDGISGFEAIKLIREFDESTPIYMIARGNANQEALRLGANGYINKNETGFIKQFQAVILKYLV